MNRKIQTILLGAICTTGLLATDGDIGGNTSVNINKLQKMFYEKGYKDGASKGYQEGYKLALQDARRKIKEYSDVIRAYENGKYLEGTDKITAPRVWQYISHDDGSTRVIVEGCKIQGKISPSDIVNLPIMPSIVKGGTQSRANNYLENESPYAYSSHNNEVTNSVSVIRRDVDDFKDDNPSLEFKDWGFAVVENNEYYINRLTRAKIPFTLASDNMLKVIFRNENEQKLFYKDIRK